MHELANKKSQTRKANRNSYNYKTYLKVDKAIILLKSNSKLAPSPAINIVNPETNNKITFNQ